MAKWDFTINGQVRTESEMLMVVDPRFVFTESEWEIVKIHIEKDRMAPSVAMARVLAEKRGWKVTDNELVMSRGGHRQEDIHLKLFVGDFKKGIHPVWNENGRLTVGPLPDEKD